MEVRLADVFPDAGALLDAARSAGVTIAAAESCTGGLFSAALTAFAGASDVVRGGVVSYADAVKVALAMAAGVRRRCEASLGVGITGVAGPGGAGESKAAGLIFVALNDGSGEAVVRLEGDGGREANRAGAVHAAIELCSGRLAARHP